MNFNKWLDTLVAEKGLDLEHVFECEGDDWGTNWIPLGCVVDFLKTQCSREVQLDVRTKLVYIDLKNGNVLHFFTFVADWMAG